MPVKTNVPAWTVQVIRVATKEGDPEPVVAFVRNGLAVHPSLGDATHFTVTHVRSGFAVRQWITREAAYELVELVKVLDWAFDDVAKMPEQTQVALRGAVRAIGKRGKAAAA